MAVRLAVLLALVLVFGGYAQPEPMVLEGWSQDLPPTCTPNGDCWDFVDGYYYRVYETEYACGTQGVHEFMVIDSETDPTVPKPLFVKFLGGGVGFWFEQDGQRVYWPDAAGQGIEYQRQNRNMFFRAGLSDVYANGVTREFRERD